jgi:AraC family transcriptional regulator
MMDCVDAFAIPPGTQFRRHEHGSVHVCAVLDGGFVEREPSGWRDVAPGTIRVSGAARHDCDFGPAGARCLLLELDDAPLEVAAPRYLAGDGRLARLACRLDAATKASEPARSFDLPGLTAEFLAQIARRLGGRDGHPPPWLGRVRELLHDTAGTVPVAVLAHEAGVHRVHLARTFRDHFGVPITAHARQLRLQAARRLLAVDALPLAGVAARAGFADQSHLTRAMRESWGITPGALRRTLHPFKTGGRTAAHSRSTSIVP